MKLRIATAALMVLAAAGLSGAAKFTSMNESYGAGAWATTNKGSVATIYADEDQGAVLGFYRNQSKNNVGNTMACDFGISARPDGVTLQIVDDKGKIHFLPVTALLKLSEPPKE
jgi:ribosomal protein L10